MKNSILISKIKYIRKERMISYQKSIKYSQYISESLNKAIDYSEYISERISDNTISYSEYLSDSLK